MIFFKQGNKQLLVIFYTETGNFDEKSCLFFSDPELRNEFKFPRHDFENNSKFAEKQHKFFSQFKIRGKFDIECNYFKSLHCVPNCKK